jgi:hypothetical protein
MQQLIYTMHFKGHAVPSEQSMTVAGNAVSRSVTTVINAGGLTGGFDPAAIADATFESEVTLVTRSTFTERGSITFGDGGHRLRFVTVGEGWMGESPDPALKQGTITWTVEGGEGQFQGARGTITSNFTLDEAGEVNDYHLGVIYLK